MNNLMEKKDFFEKIKIEDYGIAFRDYQLGKYPEHIFSMISLMRLSIMFKEEGFIYFELKKGHKDLNFKEQINEDILEFELIKIFISKTEKFLVPPDIERIIKKMEGLLSFNESQFI